RRRGEVAARREAGERRQRGSPLEVVRLGNGEGELLELFDEARVGRGGAAGTADGVEKAVVVDQSATAEDAARIQLKVVALVADRAPVQGALVGEVRLAKRAVERDRLPWPGVEHPGDVVGAPVGMADDAAAPRLAGHPGLRPAAGEEQFGPLLDGGV